MLEGSSFDKPWKISILFLLISLPIYADLQIDGNFLFKNLEGLINVLLSGGNISFATGFFGEKRKYSFSGNRVQSWEISVRL